MKVENRKCLDDAKRITIILLASVIMSINMKSFVEAGGLFPGGFNGLTLLIQRAALQFFGISIPFSLINFLLNAAPAIFCYLTIGKRFTLYSCLSIVVSSILTDLIPSMPITNDILLICIFGGIINGFSAALCLMGRATSGGTDFIAISLSERYNYDSFHYIFAGNVVMLLVAGLLFGWDKALYSIIFQFASTQVVRMLNRRYQQTTLFIISDFAEQVFHKIREATHHSATLFHGTGLYNGQSRTMLYSVISSDQVKDVIRQIRQVDPKAFINIIKTDQVSGNFYKRPND